MVEVKEVKGKEGGGRTDEVNQRIEMMRVMMMHMLWCYFYFMLSPALTILFSARPSSLLFQNGGRKPHHTHMQMYTLLCAGSATRTKLLSWLCGPVCDVCMAL